MLKFQNRTQHSVHWTLGILRHFRAFFWLQVFLLSNKVHARPSTDNASRCVARQRKLSIPFPTAQVYETKQ